MKLNNNDLIEEFYSQQKDNYPSISLEQFKDICFGPWLFLKHEMESGRLTKVRFKYFGTFQVYPGRALNMLHSINTRFRFRKIEPKQYYQLKEMLETYLKDESKD